MKHTIILFCILFSICAHAQFNRGDKFIGGNINTTHFKQKIDGSHYSVVGVSPSLGVFLNKNFALGVDPSYTNNTYIDNSTGQTVKQVARTLTYGLFAKRIFTISDKFFFALTGNVSHIRNKTTITNIGSKSVEKGYGIGINFSPSFIFFPSTHWGIEASLGNLSYVIMQLPHDSDSRTNQLDFNAGTFSLGFSYYARK